MAMISRELVAHGNFVARIDVRQGERVLLPAATFEVTSGTRRPGHLAVHAGILPAWAG